MPLGKVSPSLFYRIYVESELGTEGINELWKFYVNKAKKSMIGKYI